jgi:hypothetical protein
MAGQRLQAHASQARRMAGQLRPTSELAGPAGILCSQATVAGSR